MEREEERGKMEEEDRKKLDEGRMEERGKRKRKN